MVSLGDRSDNNKKWQICVLLFFNPSVAIIDSLSHEVKYKIAPSDVFCQVTSNSPLSILHNLNVYPEMPPLPWSILVGDPFEESFK